MSARVRRRRAAAALLLSTLVVVLVVAMAHGSGPAAPQPTAAGSTSAPAPAAAQPSGQAPAGSAAAAPATLAGLAGLGPRTSASIAATSSQVVVVRGDGAVSADATIDLYQRDGATWVRSARWRGHVGAKGWTADHHEGDLRSPIGTYTLSDAGGRQPDPGTALPYHRSTSFVPTGDSVFGDSLAGSFDYVVAIDFNRRRGQSPLDSVRPLGWSRGGGIWLHVDHGGPTHGCVSLPEAGMKALLTALSPARRPLVVMGDAATLST